MTEYKNYLQAESLCICTSFILSPTDCVMPCHQWLPEAKHHLVQKPHATTQYRRWWDGSKLTSVMHFYIVLCWMWFDVLFFSCLVCLWMFFWLPEVKVNPSSTSESTGLYTVSSQLNMKVVKANKDDQFYCEVTYFVPGGIRMTETNRINITVLCEFHTQKWHQLPSTVSYQYLNLISMNDLWLSYAALTASTLLSRFSQEFGGKSRIDFVQ